MAALRHPPSWGVLNQSLGTLCCYKPLRGWPEPSLIFSVRPCKTGYLSLPEENYSPQNPKHYPTSWLFLLIQLPTSTTTTERKIMARLKCQNGVPIQFSIDPMTLLRLHYSKACTEHLTGMELSNAAIVRDAVRHYTGHLEQLLELNPDDPHRHYLSSCLRTVMKGHTKPPDNLPERLIERPFPKLSELLRVSPEVSRERVWNELKGTWFYVQALKRKRPQAGE